MRPTRWPIPDSSSTLFRRVIVEWGELRVREKRPQNGLTLIEFIVVIVILGILSATVLFAIGGEVSAAAVAACRHDATTAEDAVLSYDIATGGTPPATYSLLTSPPDNFLQPFSANPYYSITVANGIVLVASPITAIPIPFSWEASCLGTSNVPGNPDPTSTTTTTTTDPTSTTTTDPTSTTTTTTTTTDPTSTTPNVGTVFMPNGMSVSWSSKQFGNDGGQEVLGFTNSSSITSMSITVHVAMTPGVSYNSMFATYPGSDIVLSDSSNAVTITYTYVLSGGHPIRADWPHGEIGAQYRDRGIYHPLSGDTWSITSTSGGVTSSASGVF